jgi:hypothetical protein
MCVCEDLRDDTTVCGDALAECGTVPDDCSVDRTCTDTCAGFDVCQGTACVCEDLRDDATVCGDALAECGTVADNCSADRTCVDTCTGNDVCQGTACVCEDLRDDATVCSDAGAACGMVADNCSVDRTCTDTCTGFDVCQGTACVCEDLRVDATVCSDASAQCGTVADNCTVDRTCTDTCTGFDVCQGTACVCEDLRNDATVCAVGGEVCGTVDDNCVTARTCGTCLTDYHCAVNQLSCDPDFYHCEYVDTVDWSLDMCTEFITIGTDQVAAQTACDGLLINGTDTPGDMDNSGGVSAGDRVLGPVGCDIYLDSQLALYDGFCTTSDSAQTHWQENVQTPEYLECDSAAPGSAAADCLGISGAFTCSLACVPTTDVCVDNAFDCGSATHGTECLLDTWDCGNCAGAFDVCQSNLCVCEDSRTDVEVCGAACDTTVPDNCAVDRTCPVC